MRAAPKTGSVGGESASRVKKVGGPGRDRFKMNYSLVDVSESPQEIHPTGGRFGDPVSLVHKKAKQKEMKTNSNCRKNKSWAGKEKRSHSTRRVGCQWRYMLVPVLIVTEGDGDRYQETAGLGTAYGSTNSSSSTVRALNLKVDKQQYNERDF